MSEEQRPEPRPSGSWEEKEEKQEKEYEKRDEKRDESWEEKWRRDPLNAATWALILIWAGVALLLANWGIWENLGPFGTWDIILLGAGGLLLIQVALRLLLPEYRQPVMGTVVLAVILLGLALGGMFGWGNIWPVILIIIGAVMLLRGLVSRG